MIIFTATILQAQVSGNTTGAATPYAIASRDANQNVWERTVYEQGPNGNVIPVKHHYTELASGLNYKDPQTGQWTPAKEEIDIQSDGTAAATQGQHQVYFPADIYNGVIEVVTPDGKQLQSRPTGLSYDDGNNTVLIAQLKDSTGQLVSSNQVIYPDAFTDFKADLVYTYRKGGFEQDVVLQEQPPTPQSLGLNPQTTRLQLLTEFFNAPEPSQKAMAVNARDGLADTTLTFGNMKMIQGKAFAMSSSGNNSAQNNQTTPTYKSWQQLDGRTFLVEELPVENLAAQLNALPLPPNATALNSVNSSLWEGRRVAVPDQNQGRRHGNPPDKIIASRMLPPVRLAENSTNKIQLAMADKPKSGVVLDYMEIDSDQTNFTFQAGSTYYINGEFNLSGTTTIEGGAVIKYGSLAQIYIDMNSSSVVCQTGPYRPAIFTSMNDDSVGETISGSSGSPSLTDTLFNWFLIFSGSGNITLHDMRFIHGYDAVWDTDATLDLWNCQFVDVDQAVEGNNVGLHNVLINQSDDDTFDAAVELWGTNLVAENVTDDGSSSLGFLDVENAAATVALTNCIIYGQPLLVSFSGYNPAVLSTNATFFPSSSPFQSAYDGNYYLANSSPYRGAGTTNINPALLSELRIKTTYPPTVLGSRGIVLINTNLTLSPVVPRDTNATPDVGYHYDPLDYCFIKLNDTNGTLTIMPGTVLGISFLENGSAGLYVSGAGQMICQGTAAQPVGFATVTMAQEQDLFPYEDAGVPLVNANGPFTFTKFFTGQQESPISSLATGALQDCEFYGGASLVSSASQIINCLFVGIKDVNWQSAGNNSVLRNNTFVGCNVTVEPTGTNPVVDDNLFDSCNLTNGASYTVGGGNNAFYNDTDVFSLAGDTNLVSAPGYESGPLGDYYLPSDSPLIDTGDMSASAAGLNAFTTQTNQTPDSGTVDIGYHYAVPWANSSLGTDFWLMFYYMDYNYFPEQLSLSISSPLMATGTVTVWGLPGQYLNGPVLIVSNCEDSAFNGTYLRTNLTAQEQADWWLNHLDPANSYVNITNGACWMATDTSLSAYPYLFTYNASTHDITVLYTKNDYDLNSNGDWVTFSDYTNSSTTTFCVPETNYSLPFSVAAGTATQVIIPYKAMLSWYGGQEVLTTNGVHVTASAPVSIYALGYDLQDTAAFTAYPTPLLGTNYCLMAYPGIVDSPSEPLAEFAVVAAEDGTTVWITSSATANLERGTNTYSITLNQGETYQNMTGNSGFGDMTGTVITSDKPIAVFAGAAWAWVPGYNTDAANPLVQEQLPVEDWGTNIISLGFAGRTNGDSYRILAAYTNTVVTIIGTVVTVTGWEYMNPDTGEQTLALVTKTNETLTINLTNGQFFETNLDGPVWFQSTKPIQVAQFGNGWGFDHPFTQEGDPCEILLPPVGHWLETNIVVTFTNDATHVIGDFNENFINIIVPQLATNSTYIDGAMVAVTNYVAIGASGYYGAQITITNSGPHTVTSPQPVSVEVYGWGAEDAYGYFGGMVK